MDYDLPNALGSLQFMNTRLVAANVDATAIDLANYQGIVDVLVQVGAPNNTAATPTLNFVFQDSPDNSNFNSVAGLNVNVSNVNTLSAVSLDTRAVNRYVRVRANIAGGNNPNYPVAVTGVAFLKYNPK